MKKILLIVLISFFSIHSYIVIPFQEAKNDDAYDFKNVEELLNELSYLNLYSDFYLGSYPKKLPVFFKKNIDFFQITDNQVDLLKSSSNYNPTKSESLKLNQKEKFIINNKNLISATETFNFLMTEGDINTIYKDENGAVDANNYLSLENIKIFLPDYEIQNYAGIMGFAYPKFKDEKYNFFFELKDKALIDKMIWSIDFPDIDEDTNKKGNIIIGEMPHIYAPKSYKEEQYFKMKIPEKYNNDTEYAWKLDIDSANILKKYYENTNKKEIGLSCDYIKSISIEFGLYMMYAPKKLFDQLKEVYFRDLFENNICDYKKIKTDVDKKIIVYCDKSKFEIKDQMNFPSIYFDIQKLGGNFELSYKEVFATHKEKVFLMIAFSSKETTDHIKLGQNFLYKYKFTFDYENREIGFYRTNLDSQKVMHRIKRAFRGKELIVYAFLILLVVGGFYCYKKGYIFKKKTIDYNTANKNISHFAGEDIEQGYELKND